MQWYFLSFLDFTDQLHLLADAFNKYEVRQNNALGKFMLIRTFFCPNSHNPICFVCFLRWSNTSCVSPGEGDDLPALRGLRVCPCPTPWEARKTCQDRSPGAKNINNNNNKMSKRSTVDFPWLFNRCHLSLFVSGFIFAYYEAFFRIFGCTFWQ